MFAGKLWKPVLTIASVLALACPVAAADPVTKVTLRGSAGLPVALPPVTFGQIQQHL